MTARARTTGDGHRRTALVAHPSGELYGSDRVMLESVDALLERGWRVVVTLPGDGPLLDALGERGVEVRRCPTPVLRRAYLRGLGPLRLAAGAARAIAPGLRLLRSVRPDVVYVSTVTAPLWLLLARLLRLPTVCHVHEGEASASRLVRTALALPLLLAGRVVVNSRFSLGVLTDVLPRLGARSEVVYNGVAGPDEPTPPRSELDGEVRLLYLGRLSERKGVLDAVDAVGRLAAAGVPVVLDLVGSVFPGYEWVESALRRRAEEAGVGDRVRLCGFDPDVWGHLARADVLVVPSRTDEPFGNTAVEGALAARPVVATSSGGLIEAVDGMAASVRVAPGSPVALAEAVRGIVDDWPRVAESAVADAQVARRRYAPAAYREAVAREVAALLG